MGLISKAQTDLKEAFDTDLSDVIKAFTLIKKIKGAYNTVSGEYSQITENHDSRGNFEDFGTREILADDEIKAGDKKLIIIANEILVKPEVDDIIETRPECYRYTTIKTKNVSDIIYEVQVRDS